MKFGNLVSYTGKYLSKAQGKAINGNLVFAKITGSTTLATDQADYDKDGFYIFTPGAAGLMVTKEDFNSLKSEVKALQTKVGDLKIGNNTYDTVTAYVTAQIAALQLGDASKMGVAASVTSGETGLTTGDQVYSHVSGAVAALESSISGVTGSLDNYVLKTSVKDSFDNSAADGDVASVGAVKSYVSGEVAALQLGDASKKDVAETVTTDSVDLPTASAVASYVASYVSGEVGKLGTVMSFIGVVTLAEGETFNTASATVTIGDAQVTAENGDVVIVGSKEYVWDGTSWKEFGDASAEQAAITALTERVDANSGAIAALSSAIGEITAETLAYENTSHIGDDDPTVTNVKEALDEIFDDELVIAQSLVDLNSRLDNLSGAVGAVTTNVSGDATSYSVVEGDFATGFTVKNTLATAATESTSGTAGLATDAYVASAIEAALKWEVLSDDETPAE